MIKQDTGPDSKVRGANMGPTWLLSVPDGPHVGPMNFAIRGITQQVHTYPAVLGMLSVYSVGEVIREIGNGQTITFYIQFPATQAPIHALEI